MKKIDIKIDREKCYTILSFVILAIMFVIMCLNAGRESFWVDELDWTIGFLAKPNFLEMIKGLLEKCYNLPLYYIAMYPIYKIAPYGEIWLLLPNIIMVLLGVYIVKKIGDKIGGKDLGFLSLCISATSYTLICRCAFELRPYAFLFFFSALTLYLYLRKYEESKNKKINLFYAISLMCLALSHWFGCLIVAFYFIADLILCIKKKFNKSFIIPYICSGIIICIWLIIMFIKKTVDVSKYWAEAPNLRLAYMALKYLLSNNMLCVILFLISVLLLAFHIANKKLSESKIYQFVLFGICSMVWTIGVIFIYSRFINPDGSLWSNRYFQCLLPQAFLITAIPLYELLHFKITIDGKERKVEINNIEISENVMIVLIAIILIIIGVNGYSDVNVKNKDHEQPYREISNVLAKKEDIYEENCVVYMGVGTEFLTYYFERQEYNLPQNVFEGNRQKILRRIVEDGKKIEHEKVSLDALLDYDIIYAINIHKNFDDETLEFLSNNYNVTDINKELKIFKFEKTNT